MAQFKSIPQEFIQSVFQPQIGVLTSPAAEQILAKNNLTFAELISPFSKLKNEASLRDHAGNITQIKNLQLSVQSLQQNPLPTNVARKLLNYVVSSAPEQPVINTELQNNVTIQIPSCTPWFERWRDTFLMVQYPSDHEFTRHFIACMVVISSEEVEPLTAVESLLKVLLDLQNTTPQRFPKFFSSNILRYYVILQDRCQGSSANAEYSYDKIRNVYGSDRCFSLQINSRNGETTEPPMTSNPWLPFISLSQYSTTLGSDADSEASQTPGDISIAITSPSAFQSERTFESDANVTSTVWSSEQVEHLRVFQKSEFVSSGVGELETPTSSVISGSSSVHFHPLSTASDTQSSSFHEQMDDQSTSSRTSINPIVYGAFITSQDLEQVHRLIQEFCVKALIPHVESEIQRLTDIVANRKGVSRSLFNATKRWFVTNKPGNAGPSTTSKTYNADDAEVQLRKLADLYFMFGNYPMAYQAYSTVKRDFYLDTAWQYYAGALEMAALSTFMLGEYVKKSFEYMEEAVTIYLTTCRMPQFATRATLLSAECLRGMTWWGEQAKQLIRMTSEDSDLRSALLLEQSAYCFLNCKPPMGRKYAFHIVLAGHRYSKAGQRKHTYRCYHQAAQVYNEKQWTLAEDHINYTLGRQASYLNLCEKAAESFSKLLSIHSQQNAAQQATFFKELLLSFNDIQEKDPTFIPFLPIPILYGDNTKVALLPTAPLSSPGRVSAASFVLDSNLNDTLSIAKFTKLEELVVHEASGNLPMMFKPTINVFTNETNNNTKPIGIVGETIAVVLKILNPLKVIINLRNVRLVWNFVDTKGVQYSNEDENVVHTIPAPSVILRVENTMDLTLFLTPMIPGSLSIKSIVFGLNPISSIDEQTNSVFSNIQARIDLVIRGRKQKRKAASVAQVTKDDQRLNIQVVEEAPCLQVTLSKIETELLTGEIQEVHVEMMNSGNCALTNLHFATSIPHLIYYQINDPPRLDSNSLSVKDIHRKQFVRKVAAPNDTLEPGRKFAFNMYLQAPQVKGNYSIDWMVYYQNVKDVPKYRLVKHVWKFCVSDSLQPLVQTQISESSEQAGAALSISLSITNPVSSAYVPTTAIQPLSTYLIAKRWKMGDKYFTSQNHESGMFCRETREFYLKAYRETKFEEPEITAMHLTPALKFTPPVPKQTLEYFLKKCTQNVCECDGENLEENIFTANKETEHEGMLAMSWTAQVTDVDGMRRTAYGFIHFAIEKIPRLFEEDEMFMEVLGVFNFSKADADIEEYQRRQEMSEVEKKQKKVKYNCTLASNVIEHEYNQSKICVVPLTINLTNFRDEELNTKIELLDPTYSPKSNWLHKWIGYTKPMECVLRPYGSCSFNLKLAFSTYGLFDISNFFEVYCSSFDNTPHKPIYTLQTYKSVEFVSIVKKNKN